VRQSAPVPRPPHARVAWRRIALPEEHGAWGFLAEGALLGLLLAASGAGVAWVVAATAALLAQHPLGIVLADRRRGRHHPRTTAAARVAGGYALIALVATALAVVSSQEVPYGALAAVMALALVQLAFDLRWRARALAPQLAGAAALAGVVVPVAVAGGATEGLALASWAALVARAWPSIAYVRARLRRSTGRRGDAWPVHLAGLGSAVAFVMLVAWGGWPWWVLTVPALLAVRAAHGLHRAPARVAAARVGAWEVVVGLVVVGVIAVAARAL
jgi:hypothetical protein